MKQQYDTSFYAQRRTRTLPAAKRILGLVQSRIPFTSVADFGCGTGTWLSAAIELGASKALGFEGEWLNKDMLDDPRIEINLGDLEKRVSIPEPVNLAISLEVAEHLSPARAETFVDDLCAAAPFVLFSAAVPRQGGKGHINEQWQSYWAEKFAARNYQTFDFIRPKIWGDDSIPYWYQQNSLIFAKKDSVLSAKLGDAIFPKQADLIHRELFERLESKMLSQKLRKIFGR